MVSRVNGFLFDGVTLTVNDYLVEEKLIRLLFVWSGGHADSPFKGRSDKDGYGLQQPKVPGTRMRYDYTINIKGTPTMIEFDGDLHFRCANTIYRDELKDSIMAAAGIKVVRIPYFVQLNSQTFEFFFGEKFDDVIQLVTDFKHGFITSKMYPASFCPLGTKRYNKLMAELPLNVSETITSSLKDRVAEGLPAKYVF